MPNPGKTYQKIRFVNALRILPFPSIPPPLSVYIHVPWCIKKCPYCDFNAHKGKINDLPEKSYLEAIKADLEQALPLIWDRRDRIISIFIGGGTPSLLSPSTLDKLLEHLRMIFNLRPSTEITMEVNPGKSDSKHFYNYAESGINRFSLGIQSFNDKYLIKLGRNHTALQCSSAIEIAQKLVNRINLDIMFGLPGQNLQESLSDIKKALDFEVGHLSIYQLTIEPGTIFFKRPPEMPDNDLVFAMQNAIQTKLEDNGFKQYEVSSYSLNGDKSFHNLNYWEFGDYLGLGPGAHGKISCNGKIIRQTRLNNPNLWIKNAIMHDGSHISNERAITADELPFEFMLNALRLKNGVNTDLFFNRTGLTITEIAEKIEKGVSLGFLEKNPRIIKTTPFGWRFLSELQEIFL